MCASPSSPPPSARRPAATASTTTGRRGGRRGRPKATNSPPTPTTTPTGAATCRASRRAFASSRRPAPSRAGEFTWDAAQYCADIAKASERLQDITGKKPLPLFRAPGGKTSPKLLAAAKACGYEHVGWAPAGFLGDELPSEKFSNEKLLQQALDDIQPGDILLAHLGIWSRKDPWAPAVLEPLIVGLKAKGFCFETLRQHPAYRAWIAAHP